MVRIWRAGDQLPVEVSVRPGHIKLWSTWHTLQHIQADASQSVDVGVVNFGEEADLGGSHGVVIGKE